MPDNPNQKRRIVMKKWICSVPISKPLSSIGLLIQRLVFGGFMLVGHGWGKLLNFGEKSDSFPDPLGIGSAASMGGAVFSEVVCALLIVLGLATRLAIIPFVFTMLIAAAVVHAGDPLFMGSGAAKEPALLYLAGALTLLFTGPGRYSIDYLLNKKNS
jgi:putative oxidoreductase